MSSKDSVFSKEWCDLVFGKRNQSYGAYQLRKRYNARLAKAFITTVLSVLLLVLIPQAIVGVLKKNSLTVDDIALLSEISIEEENVMPMPVEPHSQKTEPLDKPIAEITDKSEINGSTEIVADGSLADIGSKATDVQTKGDSLSVADVSFVAAEEPEEEPLTMNEVEDMPLFNGKDPMVEFKRYIGENLKYPEEALKLNQQGVVYVQFVIDKKGKVTNVKILKGVSELLDSEVVRVVADSKEWTPAKHHGKRVRVSFTLPIEFQNN